MCARNYSLRCTLDANATILCVLSATRKLARNGLLGSRGEIPGESSPIMTCSSFSSHHSEIITHTCI
jgi:hypothetical protein